ncbi:hypothetical protein ANCCAN_28267, partial [Ancylostoma caninum]
MAALRLNRYGLLVINTKSPLIDPEGRVVMKTFADFNNQRWPRTKEEFYAFFVLGSRQGGDGTVPPGNSPRARKTIHFNFFNPKFGAAKCDRFVNWPFCDKPGDKPESGQRTLHEFASSSRSTRLPPLLSEDHYRDGHNVYML